MNLNSKRSSTCCIAGVSDLSGWQRRCPEFCTEAWQAETVRPEQLSRSSHRPEWGSWEPTSCSRPTASRAPPAPDAGLKNTDGAAVRRLAIKPRPPSPWTKTRPRPERRERVEQSVKLKCLFLWFNIRPEDCG